MQIRIYSLLALSFVLAAGCDGKGGDSGLGPADGGDGSDGADGSDGDDTGSTEPPFTTCTDDGTTRICTLSGDYTDVAYHMTADWIYILDGGVFFGDDTSETVLTIDPGVTVYGSNANKGFLVIRRNSRIEAEGTASSPIVFTSEKFDGERGRGDWGGLVINGNAPINTCSDGSAPVSGCTAEGEGGSGTYGGDDPSDDSGTLRYVRVEFGGIEITSENEVNGIALQGVGSGTTIDHVQVHMNLDDGIEMFGGTVNLSNVLITGAGDDSLDWTSGWTGTAESIVLQQYSDDGDRCIEGDNDEDQMEALPLSRPTLRHLTCIGRDHADSIGIILRHGTGASLENVLVTGSGKGCIDIDSGATWAHINGAVSGWMLTIESSVMACSTQFVEDTDDAPNSVALWFEAQEGNTTATDAMLSGWIPEAGSPADLGGGSHAGAFAVGGTDWTTGWTTSVSN